MHRFKTQVPLAIFAVVLGLSLGCPPVTPDKNGGSGGDTDTGAGQCDSGILDCSTDTQCDDGDSCTADSCDAGCCDSAAIECNDDGTFCNGVESCDPDTGACVSSGNPCRPNESCEEPQGRCRPEQPGELSVSIAGCPKTLSQGNTVDLVAATSNASSTVTYQWELLHGSGFLDNPTSRTPTLTANETEELTIRVTATEGTGIRSAAANCTVDVTPNSTA